MQEALKKRYNFKGALFKVRLGKEEFICDIWDEEFSETAVVPLLISVAWKGVVETVID